MTKLGLSFVSFIFLAVNFVNAAERSIVFRGLSDDPSKALFHAVLVGYPEGEYAAFVIRMVDGCSIIVIQRGNILRTRLTDFSACQYEDYEDGYSILDRSNYQDFILKNSEAILNLLLRYQIDPYVRFDISKPFKSDDEECVSVGELVFCAGNTLNVR